MNRPELLYRKREQNGTLWTVFYIVVAIVIAILAANLWIGNHYFSVRVKGGSMNDTLYGGVYDETEQDYVGGDVLFAKRDISGLKRGDIVVIDVSDISHFQKSSPTTNIIKRLIAVEGDTVRIGDGKVYITYAGADTEIELPEPYVNGTTEPKRWDEDGNLVAEWTLGKGEIFVLGDNRKSSDDSRYLEKALQRNKIVGVVLDWSLSEGSQGGIEAFFVRGFLSGVFSFS